MEITRYPGVEYDCGNCELLTCGKAFGDDGWLPMYLWQVKQLEEEDLPSINAMSGKSRNGSRWESLWVILQKI